MKKYIPAKMIRQSRFITFLKPGARARIYLYRADRKWREFMITRGEAGNMIREAPPKTYPGLPRFWCLQKE
jgi:hypothetical protein